MTADQSSVTARARVHAALADPTRLSIVDMLRPGDLSPGEIAGRLDLPTNLVAHHVGVLLREGLVARTRSEGDRRRTYLRLTAGVSADPLAPQALSARRVVFVCTRNSARSRLAAALWAKASPIPSASAGTDPAPAVHELTLTAAQRCGLRLGDGAPRHVAQVVRQHDLLVAVCDNAHEQLPGTVMQRLHWSVRDPVPVGNDKAFDVAVADLSARVGRLAPLLTRKPLGRTK
ncbi:MAG TPA: helix-turn-helix domain-containing protein [Candidatus Limnocylindrales bacterium]